ncbi:MAG TPA: hypothetical protein VHM25_01035 [Polyangiaceae bacterium]|jgi:hypothetical protein|nr:hypothetical protein [Polyangiaceae bacterium]
MTSPKRWLDELPHGSHERELLLVGKAARPAEGAIEANWKALCATLGTTAAISGTFATHAATAAASTSTSVKVGASLVTSQAVGTGLALVAAKSLAVGIGIGLAVMGAATLVERARDGSAQPAAATKPSPAVDARRPLTHAPPTPLAEQPDPSPEPLEASPSSSAAGLARPREWGTPPAPGLNSLAAPAVSAPSALAAQEETASLARQARELAELKRLIDNGATREALRRLDKNFDAGTASLLSEERDALYVQALARAGRRDEARALARQFLTRYPHSPYFETMRQLLSEQ